MRRTLMKKLITLIFLFAGAALSSRAEFISQNISKAEWVLGDSLKLKLKSKVDSLPFLTEFVEQYWMKNVLLSSVEKPNEWVRYLKTDKVEVVWNSLSVFETEKIPSLVDLVEVLRASELEFSESHGLLVVKTLGLKNSLEMRFPFDVQLLTGFDKKELSEGFVELMNGEVVNPALLGFVGLNAELKRLGVVGKKVDEELVLWVAESNPSKLPVGFIKAYSKEIALSFEDLEQEDEFLRFFLSDSSVGVSKEIGLELNSYGSKKSDVQVSQIDFLKKARSLGDMFVGFENSNVEFFDATVLVSNSLFKLNFLFYGHFDKTGLESEKYQFKVYTFIPTANLKSSNNLRPAKSKERIKLKL
jgi:hypothetical protein